MRRHIFMIRHAESEWNCAGEAERKNGRTKNGMSLRDADLSRIGEQQLEVLEKYISITNLFCDVAVIYSSPLTRAIKTADSVRKAIYKLTGKQIEIKILTVAREIRRDIGDVGTAGKVLAKKFPSLPALKKLPVKWWAEKNCDCELLSECDKCVRHRLKALMSAISTSQNAILVTHGDLIETICGYSPENIEIVHMVIRSQ